MKAPHSQKEPGSVTKSFSEKLKDALASSASKGRPTRTMYSLVALAAMTPKGTSSRSAEAITEKSTALESTPSATDTRPSDRGGRD